MKIPLVVSLLLIATGFGARALEDHPDGAIVKFEKVLERFVKSEAVDLLNLFEFIKAVEAQASKKLEHIVMSTVLLGVLKRKLAMTDLKPQDILSYTIVKKPGNTKDFVTLFTAKTPHISSIVTCEATIEAKVQPLTVFSFISPEFSHFELLHERLKCNYEIIVGPKKGVKIPTKSPHTNTTRGKIPHEVHSKHAEVQKYHTKIPLHKVPVKHMSTLHKVLSPPQINFTPVSIAHKGSPDHNTPILPHKVNGYSIKGLDESGVHETEDDGDNSESDDLNEAGDIFGSYDPYRSDYY